MRQGRIASIPTVASLLAAFFAIALVAGVLGAGLAMPAVAAFGTVTKSTIGMYDNLPSEFSSVVPNQTTTIYAKDGKTVIAQMYSQNRIIVPLEQIAPIMRKAQVAIEDKRFYQHGGVDVEGMGAVAAGVLAGKSARGASTLTQQYVKVTLITAAERRRDSKAADAAKAPTAARKLQEMKYATEVEKVMTKDQILQNYLNLVYFGDLSYGVEAAARHFFSTTAAKLTLPQAATLAGSVQNPTTVNAVANPKAMLKRRNVVLGAMHEQKVISDAEYKAAVATPLGVKLRADSSQCPASRYPFVCAYVHQWLLSQPALGDSPKARDGRLLNDGLKVVTTIDPHLEAEAQTALRTRVFPADYKPQPDPSSVGGAAATIDPNTGKVRSLVLSTDYSVKGGPGKQSVNWAVDSTYGASGGFNIGSTMKMFALAYGLDSGKLTVGSTINDIRPAPAHYDREDYPGLCTVDGVNGWNVKNSEGDINPTSVSLREATAQSVNTAFAALVKQLGACEVRAFATKMGLHTASPYNAGGNGAKRMTTEIETAVPGIVLGSNAVSPMTVARTYGVIAAKGMLCPERPVESVSDSSGKPIDLKLPGCTRVMSEAAANGVADLLKSVITSGTGKGLDLADGRTAAGKTGTDDGNESWFAGITPQLSTAVWVGTPNANFKCPTCSEGAFRNVTVAGRFHPQVFGAEIAGPIWQDIMNTASAGMPKLDFGQVGPVAAAPNGTIPDVSGMDPDAAMSALTAAGYKPYISKRVASGSVTPGMVAYTYPPAGAAADPGTSVGLRIARGGYASNTPSSGGASSGTTPKRKKPKYKATAPTPASTPASAPAPAPSASASAAPSPSPSAAPKPSATPAPKPSTGH